MNNTVYQRIFDIVKDSVEAADGEFRVFKKPAGSSNQVVIQQSANAIVHRSSQLSERHSRVGITIDIFAQPTVVDGVMIDGLELAYKTAELVMDIMENTFYMSRISFRPTPNVDTTVERLTIQYSAVISDYRSLIY